MARHLMILPVALLVKALIYGIDPFNGVDRAAGAAGLVGAP